jgi:hypothetical protein
MKGLAFAMGLLVLGVGAATPASADFAVVKFGSGYCRVWAGTPGGPQDGKYLWFKAHHHHHKYWHYRFHTAAKADWALHRAAAHHRCNHWWW